MDFVDNNIQKVYVQPEDQVYARNEDIKVYGKLVSMSTENVVADSEQIWDKGLNKNQSEINFVTQSKFGQYLPLTGGTLTGTLRLNDINSDQNGLDINNVNGIQSVDQNKVSTPEVWTTNGGSIDLINLLKNAAIYVAGGFELAESDIDNTTVVDSPDKIIFDGRMLGGRFLAKKGLTCYTHWKADIHKNIAPPSRYGIETDDGVFPFNNQMYKFSQYDDIFITTCSNGGVAIEELTLE